MPNDRRQQILDWLTRYKSASLDELGAALHYSRSTIRRDVLELEEMGLRVPQITKIMQELVAMGLPVDASTLTVDDALHQLIPILKRKEELR